MSTREDRYFEAVAEQRHMLTCGLCLIGRPDLCPGDDEDDGDE
jgi:hypothetical protein